MPIDRFDIPQLVRDALSLAVAQNTLDAADVYALCSEHGTGWAALMQSLGATAFAQRHGKGGAERHGALCRLIDEFHRQPTAKRREAPPQLPGKPAGKRTSDAGPARNLPVLHVPQGSAKLPDLRGWTNRFEIRSESSDRIYIVSQNIENRHWGCSCPAWRTRRQCKHLAALLLPAHEQPYEARLA